MNDNDPVLGKDESVERAMHRMSRRSFLWGAVAVAAGFDAWRWFIARPDAEGLPASLRAPLEFDGKVARALYNPARLATTFERTQATEPRVNGEFGLNSDLDAAIWALRVTGLHHVLPANEEENPDKANPAALFDLDDIKALPHVEMTTELKCIEGWSNIVHWGGVRLADFIAKYPPKTHSGAPPDVLGHPGDLVDYVGISTPDGEYYVGLEMQVALHPQTLLCYEMNGQPLTDGHGAPLRLVTPLKYGIKNIKRIGNISYNSARPPDYWFEQGYDYYAGH